MTRAPLTVALLAALAFDASGALVPGSSAYKVLAHIDEYGRTSDWIGFVKCATGAVSPLPITALEGIADASTPETAEGLRALLAIWRAEQAGQIGHS